jgi:hypothetical protein
MPPAPPAWLPRPEVLTSDVLPPSSPPVAGDAPADVAVPPPSLDAWLLPPLLWANRTFDRLTLRLGRPGAWLRGKSGRAALGATGLLLLALAAAWLVGDALGWTG